MPGDFIAERPVNSLIQPAGLPIAAPLIEALRRPVESTQFVSLAFGLAARDAGIAVSMDSRGDAYDNAVAESFFATLKKELIHARSWPTRRELIGEVFEYIEAFYNPTRRHSTLGYLSPAEFETSTLAATDARLAASRLASPNDNINQQPRPNQPCPPKRGHSTDGSRGGPEPVWP